MLLENGSLLGYTMLDFKRSRMLCESSAMFARFGGAVRHRRQSNKWLILCFGDTKLAQVQQTTLSDIKEKVSVRRIQHLCLSVLLYGGLCWKCGILCKHINMRD